MHASATSAPQLQSRMEQTFSDRVNSARPLTTSASSQLPPPPLFALVASHLDVATLLRLQRCSSTQHGLCADDAYMAVAWRWAELHLWAGKRLHEWTLQYEQCIDSNDRSLIQSSVWQAALPMWRAVLTRAKGSTEREQCQWHDRLRTLMEREQPTVWVQVEQTEKKLRLWKAFGANSDMPATAKPVDVRRVEVLRDITWWQLDRGAVASHRDVDIRCRLVLRACPYLQHLDFSFDIHVDEAPSHADTFALVPRLRSLRLDQSGVMLQRNSSNNIDFRVMLDSLPHLHTLSCKDIMHLGISDLLHIASHSTLEEVHIESSDRHIEHYEWIGDSIRFPAKLEADEQQMEEESARYRLLGGDVEAEDSDAITAALISSQFAPMQQLTGNVEKGESEREEARAEMHRLHTALTRTQPSQHSCEVRLALADWLHRRLRRGRLYTDEERMSKSLLRRYRSQVAQVRSTLQSQLSELAAQLAASELSPSEVSKTRKRADLES